MTYESGFANVPFTVVFNPVKNFNIGRVRRQSIQKIFIH